MSFKYKKRSVSILSAGFKYGNLRGFVKSAPKNKKSYFGDRAEQLRKKVSAKFITPEKQDSSNE